MDPSMQLTDSQSLAAHFRWYDCISFEMWKRKENAGVRREMWITPFWSGEGACIRALCVRNVGINDLKWARSKQEPFAHVCTTVLIVGITPELRNFLQSDEDAFPSWVIIGHVRCTSYWTRERDLLFFNYVLLLLGRCSRGSFSSHHEIVRHFYFLLYLL